jgi:hypothetical protein
MPSFEYDLRYLQAGLEQLENYLLANDLYRSIGVGAPSGEPPYPQLTPGGLLLALARMRALAASQAQQSQLSEAERRLDDIRTRWRVAWGKKASADFHARLKLWGDFLNEYRDQTTAHYDRYPYEVSRRVQLNLLAPETLDLPTAEQQALNGLDKLLRVVFIPGPFIWETKLVTSFPQPDYWFLYGDLRKELA